MAKTYASQMKNWTTCGTEYCGAVHKYFCVRCRHYLQDCRCTPGNCSCENNDGWARHGERSFVRAQLLKEGKRDE